MVQKYGSQRPNSKQSRPPGGLLLVMLALLFSFQNCDTTLSETDPFAGSSQAQRDCGGRPCLASNAEALQILVNSNPIVVLNTATQKDTAFDVAGYCDSAGFPDTRIYWQIEGVTAVAIAPAGCSDLGRFRFRVDLPTTYNYSQIHTLVVSLRGLDEEGQEHVNPILPEQQRVPIQSAGR